MSIARILPSFLKPTLVRARIPGRARPMKCSSSRVMRIITGALAFFDSSAGIAVKIELGILLPNPPPVYSLMNTICSGGMPTHRATDATDCTVLWVDACIYSLPFCQYAIAERQTVYARVDPEHGAIGRVRRAVGRHPAGADRVHQRIYGRRIRQQDPKLDLHRY